MLRIFFCFNEVSYSLALEAIRRAPGRALLVVSPDRVRKRENAPPTLHYRLAVALSILVLSLLSRRIEVVLPHARTSPALRLLARGSRHLAFIDDGMDTFRRQPRNLTLDVLRAHAPYYTFRHAVPIADWVGLLQPVPLLGIESLAQGDRPPLPLTGYACLVIESPGVDLAAAPPVPGRAFFLRHPNPDKNLAPPACGASASGLEWSAEKTILQFDGHIVVGESMALVFALACCPDRKRIHVRLRRSSYDNLNCLHSVMATCGSLQLNDGG